jgi:hypothetical protein
MDLQDHARCPDQWLLCYSVLPARSAAAGGQWVDLFRQPCLSHASIINGGRYHGESLAADDVKLSKSSKKVSPVTVQRHPYLLPIGQIPNSDLI